MAFFSFFQNLFTSEYEVTARRYLVPLNGRPVFQIFKIRARSKYEACREFDTTLSAWTRLDVRRVD